MSDKRIAVIGSGISGLTAAYYLSQACDVTIYEAADYVGGHTHTVSVEKDGEHSDIDTGFIVFNDRTYPRFIHLLDTLGVPYQPTEMSFSVRNDHLDLEYNGNNLNSMFAQRANLLRPLFWRLLFDIVRFNRAVRKERDNDSDVTLGQYLQQGGYSDTFRDNYLLPMVSAIWSMGLESTLDFPLQFFAAFFDNHGLLNVVDRPQWYTIEGGSSKYIEPLTRLFGDRIRLSTPITSLERLHDGVHVITQDREVIYDEVIVACHGDQALALLADPSEEERRVLSGFQCSENQVVLHTDIAHLPRRRLAWASWNYRQQDTARERSMLTYNMNILQRLNKQHTYLVTLNQEIDQQHVLAHYVYRHPIFSKAAIASQKQWDQISGRDRIHFCGAYWFNGFHEDGVRSAMRVVKMMEAL